MKNIYNAPNKDTVQPSEDLAAKWDSNALMLCRARGTTGRNLQCS